MEDCGVCYVNEPRCKLVCGHAFCYQCVKSWYQKSDEPSCPMCRGSLYFRKMRKHLDKWEAEGIDAHNEECFNNALEEIFDEEDLEYFGTDDILFEIEELQKRYQDFVYSGYDMEEILSASEEDIITSSGLPHILDDMFIKNPFVSKHQSQRRKMRTGKRVMGKRDSSLALELVILRIEV